MNTLTSNMIKVMILILQKSNFFRKCWKSESLLLLWVLVCLQSTAKKSSFTCCSILKPHEGDIVCCWLLGPVVSRLFLLYLKAVVLMLNCWIFFWKGKEKNLTLHVKNDLKEKVLFTKTSSHFFLPPHAGIRQYDECQQVSEITLTYLQVKSARLPLFFSVVGHFLNNRVAVKSSTIWYV